LDTEARLEKLLIRDISTISDDLLIIGEQVTTDFGGAIDLLCLDRNGDVVIVELKRERTPRDVTAQALDYASWVRDLSAERIIEIANTYLGSEGSLEEAFKQRFGADLPEALNTDHKMLIVASEIDANSERIITYLSSSYGVPINAVTFQYFCEDKKELLARVFLIEPSQAEPSSGKRRLLSWEKANEIAESKGLGQIYRRLVEGLTGCFDQRAATASTGAFLGIMEGRRYTIFHLVPGKSDSSQGVRFEVYIDRLSDYLGAKKDEVIKVLPSESKKYEPWKGAPSMLAGFFRDIGETDRFLSALEEFKRRQAARKN